MDKVRIPISVVPYEDQSADHRRELKAQKQQAAADISDPAAVETEAGKDSESQVSETAEEETAASTQTSEDTTAPPSDGSKKD